MSTQDTPENIQRRELGLLFANHLAKASWQLKYGDHPAPNKEDEATFDQVAAAVATLFGMDAAGYEARPKVATVALTNAQLDIIQVKVDRVEDLSFDDLAELSAWCETQSSDLWDGMKLQDILNVYRVSADWVTWESWAEEEREEAHAAWNRVVADPNEHMIG